MYCSICQYSSAFGLSLTFYSFYLRHPGGHLLGTSCCHGFPLVLFLFYAVFTVCVPYPFGVWERMRNWIVSLPDYCLCIYFTIIFRPHLNCLNPVSSQCGKSFIARKPEVHPKIFKWYFFFKNVTLQILNFILVNLLINISSIGCNVKFSLLFLICLIQ